MTPELTNRLFTHLRRMDEEATTTRDGSPTGLSWYGGHRRPDLKKPQTEVEWSRHLAELLEADGFTVRREVAYPNLPRARCDLVIELGPGRNLWIEIKGAWKEYWRRKGREWIYRAYLLHPLVPGLDESKTHTVPLDLKKLASLRPEDAASVAVLLIGFHADDDPMDGDIAQLVELAGLHAPAWQCFTAAWPDVHRDGRRVSCWCWCRNV